MPPTLRKPEFNRQTDSWGIDSGYEDALRNWHHATPATLAAVREAMGAALDHPPAPAENLLVTRTGKRLRLPQSARLHLESGEELAAVHDLPGDLPAGYHELHFPDSETPTRLIVSPAHCYLPRDLKTWGWAVQLYAARSRNSWGIGDLHDLESLSRWSAGRLGAGMMLINPLSCSSPGLPQQASPYYPTSRRFFNPIWIHVESAPGARELDSHLLETAAAAGRRLNQQRLIDRDRVYQLKMSILERLWSRFPGDPVFDAFCEQQGQGLERFATFCALAIEYGPNWHAWPQPFCHPAKRAVADFAAVHRPQIDFHKWLQWIVDEQLAHSSRHLALMQDLPIGVDPNGADAWALQDVLASGASVGAPPDEFNTQGQNWGLPPFVPHKLRAAGYEPFIQTIRAAFRHAGGLRIDHVMGLFRLYWIPNGMHPKDGAFVRYNADEMLAIVALESQRAQAYVVGEDLGTVEDEARDKLAAHKILSYRLLWFEKDAPGDYPEDALAAITTHDLPTVVGLWTGSDIERQHELKLKPNEESTNEICDRLTSMTALNEEAPLEEVVARAHELLARAPSRIVTAALDDVVLVPERPNIPATTGDQNPNWCLALPVPIDDLMQAELPRRIARALARTAPMS